MAHYQAPTVLRPATVEIAALWSAARRLLPWIRKNDRELASAVVRLSDLSPHLLQDVGFEPTSGPGGLEWSDGTHHVAVPRRDAATRLMRIGRV